jgi:hypothetical protein
MGISLCWRNLKVSGDLVSSSTREETNMKLTTIALATVFALSSTFALAEENPATGAQGGATGVPGVKTNPTPEQATQGGTTGVPGAKTELGPSHVKNRQKWFDHSQIDYRSDNAGKENDQVTGHPQAT